MAFPVKGFTAQEPVATPLTRRVSAMRSRSERFRASAMYRSTASRFSGVVSSPTHSCSGAMTMNVTPKIVSGRVVKISSLRSEPWMSKKTCAPTERPIQLRWISLSESLHSNPSSPSSIRWA